MQVGLWLGYAILKEAIFDKAERRDTHTPNGNS